DGGAGGPRGMAQGAALEEPRRAGVILGWTRPEGAHVTIEALVRDAAVVGDAAAREPPQLVEDVGRRMEVEALTLAEPACQLADDLPVAPRLARRLDGLPDADDAALDARHRAVVLLVQRAGEHEVGVTRRLRQEEVDRDE